MNSTKTRSQQWTLNSQKRRKALAQEGGGQYFALLDGDYMRKVMEIMAWRNPAWIKNHGRKINKTDLLKLMIDAELNQVNRRKRASPKAQRNGQGDARPIAHGGRASAHP